MDVGAQLREARLRVGLSREQFAQRTKIQAAKIDALERDAFDRLPEGVYLDGLVRAYAREVGLDDSEMVRRVRVAVARWHDQRAEADDLGHLAIAAGTHAHAAGGTAVAARDRADDREELDVDTFEPRAAAPERDLGAATLFAPVSAASPRRHGLGAIVFVIALLAAVGSGAYLYQQSQPFTARQAIDVPALSEENAADAARAVNPDPGATPPPSAHPGSQGSDPGASTPSAEAGGITASRSDTAAATTRPGPDASTTVPAGTAMEKPRSEPVAPSATAAPGAATTAPDTPDTPGVFEPAAAVEATKVNVEGFWTLDTRVESTSYAPYEGMQLGYRLRLRQDGMRVTGGGIKIAENGEPIGESAQTPIALEGILDGKRLILTFTERGTQRFTEGKMILDLNDDGVFRGRFSSGAARSTGLVEARRPEG